jgi:hypothetical protein
MISILIEAGLRSLLFGLVVAIAVRAFRVRNVVAQKSAWIFVLIAAFAMPLLRPVTARWHILPASANILLPTHPMTLLEELQAKIQTHRGSVSKSGSSSAWNPQGGSLWAEKPSVSVSGPVQNPHVKEGQPGTARAPQQQTAVAPVRRGVSLIASQSSFKHQPRPAHSLRLRDGALSRCRSASRIPSRAWSGSNTTALVKGHRDSLERSVTLPSRGPPSRQYKASFAGHYRFRDSVAGGL